MSVCECASDGFCQRYRREMRGRFRELCRGINVDLGTAAAFREQWAREAGTVTPVKAGAANNLVLRTEQAPGDALVMTAAIYSLHRANPGKFKTAVDTPYREVFENNPDVVPIGELHDASDLQMHYPAIHQSNERGIHFMQGCCEFLQEALNVPVPLATNKPMLYFSSEPIPPSRPYWLICSGIKRDFTNKRWGHARFQEVVDRLEGRVRFVQVGAVGAAHDHKKLDGVDDMLGKTTLRELFELVRSAQGVLCGVSLLMHVASALDKPAVVIAGGREPVPWNAYPLQHYLHTVGMFPCCATGACGRSRTVPIGDNVALDKDPCEFPVCEDETIPLCMISLTPAQVAKKIGAIASGRGLRHDTVSV